MNINKILDERGARYGAFDCHASITQRLKRVMQEARTSKWKELSPSQKESLEMIAHKIGRILSGDPNYDDSWVDIAGYAQLIVNELHIAITKIEDNRINRMAAMSCGQGEAATDIDPHNPIIVNGYVVTINSRGNYEVHMGATVVELKPGTSIYEWTDKLVHK